MLNFKNKTPVFGLAIALAILTGIGFNSYQKFHELSTLQDETKRSFIIASKLDRILLLLTQSETSQRGYLLTGNSTYLDLYLSSSSEIKPVIKEVKFLSNNQGQQQQIKALEPLVEDKLDELLYTINLRQTKSLESALSVVNTNRGKQVMDKIQELAAEIKKNQDTVIRQRNELASKSGKDTANLFLACILPSLFLIGWAVYTLNEEIDAQRELQASLKLLNEELESRVKLRTSELESANRAKDEFLSVLSHELRTPLTAILGWTKLLYSEESTSSSARSALEIIERNAKSQAQLIEDILDISRIIQGKFRLEVRSLDFTSLVESAIDSVRLAASGRQIRIQSILDTNNSLINGDAERLQSVIWNLLSNAIKFTPKGGKIEVKLRKVNSSIELSVADNGIGISPEFLPYVFDRFRQADSTSTRAHGGLGLGLAIAKQIMEMHGGTITANSKGEGMGSVFIIALPIAVARTQQLYSENIGKESLSSLPFKSSSALAGLTVLVVDDYADARVILKAMLERSGAIVVEAGSTREALIVLNNSSPDVLVSDVGMPYEDGYELIKQIRASEKYARIPAIALTAYARDEDKVRSLEAGFQVHMSKPVEPAYLVAVVAKVGRGI